MSLRLLSIVLIGACGSASHTPPPAKGTVVTKRFHSNALGVDKNYLVYLPVGYEAAPTTRWPVFYLLHGTEADETALVESGMVDHADALSLQAILVMPDADNSFYVDAVTSPDYDECIATGAGLLDPDQRRADDCVRTRAYETYVIRDLIAEVDHTLHTIPTREGRSIGGMSMGGFGSLHLAFRHPELFAATAAHAGLDAFLYAGSAPYDRAKVELVTDPASYRPESGMHDWMIALFGDDIENWRRHDPATLAKSLGPVRPAIYLDCGSEDALLPQMLYLHDILDEQKIEHVYTVVPGGKHNYEFAKRRGGESLKFLRDHTAKPTRAT